MAILLPYVKLNRMRYRVTKLRSLGWKDTTMLVRAAGLLLWTECRLKLLKRLGRGTGIHTFLQTVPGGQTAAEKDVIGDEACVILAVNRASRALRVGACLTRALVATSLLRRRGSEAVVRVGVRRSHGKLEAHAWVEGPSVPLASGNSSQGYAPLVPVPTVPPH